MATTYTQFASNTHRAGGETMTEAVAKRVTLARCSTTELRVLRVELQKEAVMCSNMADYALVRAQVERVRAVLNQRHI